MNSKAQTQHVFLYLFALFIIGALVLIGYKAITRITTAGCDAGKETFKSELINLIEQYDTKGSSHLEKMSTHCSFTQLCFLDSDVILDSAPLASNAPLIVKDAQTSQSHTNLWLNKGDSWESIGWSEKVEIESTANYLCIKARGGTFPVQFKGLGRRTRVALPN